MSTSQRRALIAHRRRLRQRGIARVEIRVRRDDAALVRSVVEALADPARAEAVRALLREQFPPGRAKGLKDLLARAPLEGIDLERPRDFGRDVDA